jgi:hypothetical protein
MIRGRPRKEKEPWGGYGIHVVMTDCTGPMTPQDMSGVSDEDWAKMQATIDERASPGGSEAGVGGREDAHRKGR